MINIKTILYQLRKRPLITATLILVITFVITFISITYSSMKYNSKLSNIERHGHSEEKLVEYTFASLVNKRTVNKEYLNKIAENCDMELSFFSNIDSISVPVSIVYLNNKTPEISLYHKRAIEEGGFNVAYVGNEIEEEFKDSVTILEKSYKVGETIGVKGEITSQDTRIIVYTDNIEDIYDTLVNGEFLSGGGINLYKNNKKYSSYDEDMSNMLNEEEFYIRNVTTKRDGIKSLRYGFQYKSLIIIGISSIVIISIFWIEDRRKELAIKRALGAKKKHILYDIYKELFTISILCGGVSFIINYTLSIASNNINSIRLSVNMIDFLWFFLFTLLISSMVAIIPVYKAINSDIVTSLKGR